MFNRYVGVLDNRSVSPRNDGESSDQVNRYVTPWRIGKALHVMQISRQISSVAFNQLVPEKMLETRPHRPSPQRLLSRIPSFGLIKNRCSTKLDKCIAKGLAPQNEVAVYRLILDKIYVLKEWMDSKSVWTNKEVRLTCYGRRKITMITKSKGEDRQECVKNQLGLTLNDAPYNTSPLFRFLLNFLFDHNRADLIEWSKTELALPEDIGESILHILPRYRDSNIKELNLIGISLKKPKSLERLLKHCSNTLRTLYCRVESEPHLKIIVKCGTDLIDLKLIGIRLLLLEDYEGCFYGTQNNNSCVLQKLESVHLIKCCIKQEDFLIDLAKRTLSIHTLKSDYKPVNIRDDYSLLRQSSVEEVFIQGADFEKLLFENIMQGIENLKRFYFKDLKFSSDEANIFFKYPQIEGYTFSLKNLTESEKKWTPEMNSLLSYGGNSISSLAFKVEKEINFTTLCRILRTSNELENFCLDSSAKSTKKLKNIENLEFSSVNYFGYRRFGTYSESFDQIEGSDSVKFITSALSSASDLTTFELHVSRTTFEILLTSLSLFRVELGNLSKLILFIKISAPNEVHIVCCSIIILLNMYNTVTTLVILNNPFLTYSLRKILKLTHVEVLQEYLEPLE